MKLILPWKSGHKESGVYNPFCRCSNEQEAQKIFERILKRVCPFNSWRRQLDVDVFKRAFKNECIGSTLIHLFDRGVQHVSKEFQALLKTNDILCSMSRKGNCRDNVVVESFLHIYSYIDKKHSSFALFMFLRGYRLDNV